MQVTATVQREAAVDTRELERATADVYRALVAMGARREEAEDATQEAAERALSSSAHIERLAGWLFVVALRTWRGRRLRDRLLRPLAFWTATTSAPDDTHLTLLGEVARLPRRQREVLVARYVIGLTQKETAKVLGMAQGTVTATQAQATRKLRERLGDDFGRS